MTKYKDEKWATWNLTLGWPTQGIWPPCSSGDDINSVDRAPSGDGKDKHNNKSISI